MSDRDVLLAMFNRACISWREESDKVVSVPGGRSFDANDVDVWFAFDRAGDLTSLHCYGLRPTHGMWK